ncbi:MAG: DUF503 domain-containing protein [Actinobacteria bacterium]|nr:MAG: DUF503 domain-containing protein [Actinomycetota bacterium]
MGAEPVRGFVAVLTIDLHFPDATSLKAKRKELAPVKAYLQGRAGAAVAEVGHHDRWQRATLLAALAEGSAPRAEAVADGVQRWLDARFPQGVSVRRTLASLQDLQD